MSYVNPVPNARGYGGNDAPPQPHELPPLCGVRWFYPESGRWASLSCVLDKNHGGDFHSPQNFMMAVTDDDIRWFNDQHAICAGTDS